MSVANEIYRQLGGNKFAVMTGAKNFIDLENGIRMKIGRNKTNHNWMEITLNSLDLYDVAFAKLTKLGFSFSKLPLPENDIFSQCWIFFLLGSTLKYFSWGLCLKIFFCRKLPEP